MTSERRSILAALTSALDELCIPYAENDPLSRRTSFRIGGPAAIAVNPRTRAEFIAVLDLCREKGSGLPVMLLGRGSNVLFSDEGYAGVVIRTSKVNRVVFDTACDACKPNGLIYADCGVSLSALAAACVTEGRALAGLSFAHGIPGSVGGAVVMNAGAYGGEMAQVVCGCDYYDMDSGQEGHLSAEELQFSYRHSVFSDHPSWVVLGATLALPEGNAAAIQAEMDANALARRTKQPLEYPSAGSVFKRPATGYMGQMVEACGLKGYTVGGAQVSEKHAGFIINRDHATAADVRAVIEHIQTVIEQNYGFIPECEIRIIPPDEA